MQAASSPAATARQEVAHHFISIHSIDNAMDCCSRCVGCARLVLGTLAAATSSRNSNGQGTLPKMNACELWQGINRYACLLGTNNDKIHTMATYIDKINTKPCHPDMPQS